MVSWAHPSLRPKRHVDRFSRFCVGPKCCTICIVVGEKPQNCPFTLAFRHPTRKDRECGSGDILADRQTDTNRRTHHNTSHGSRGEWLHGKTMRTCSYFAQDYRMLVLSVFMNISVLKTAVYIMLAAHWLHVHSE